MAGLSPPTEPAGIPHWRYLYTNFDGTGQIDFVGDYLIDFKVPGFRSLYRGFKVWKMRYYIKSSGANNWQINRYANNVPMLARWTNLTRAEFFTGLPGVALHAPDLLHDERGFIANSHVTRIVQDFAGVNDRWLIWEFDFAPMGGIVISRYERAQVVFLDDFSLLEGHRVSIEMEFLVDNNKVKGGLD